jgi:hypothetical protein
MMKLLLVRALLVKPPRAGLPKVRRALWKASSGKYRTVLLGC